MNKKKVTIKDIAEYLEINISTVSRALKNHKNISPKTKAKVNKAAEELGYETIRPRKRKLIGIIIQRIGTFFTPKLVSAIEKVAKTRGYNLIVFQTHNSLETEKECANLCKDFKLDGLLVSLTRETTDLKHFDFFFENSIPIVFVDRIIDDEQREISAVLINDKEAAKRAVGYLIRRGYTNIAGAFSDKRLSNTIARKEGFREALDDANLTYNPNLCFHANNKEEAKKEFLELIKREGRPQVIFAMGDGLLLGIIQATYKEKIHIPEQLGIISISNGDLPTYLNPSITHILHSADTIGAKATTYLINLIEHPETTDKEIIHLPVGLVEMESCKQSVLPNSETI